MDWIRRIKIAHGTAEGLAYLHLQANPPVIYRDLKPSNILVDDDFNPKLSDFASVSIGGGDVALCPVQSRAMVTYGYSAPEYSRSGQLTSKSDVYSFGVILLELITGRRAMDTTRPNDEQNLVQWAQPIFRDPKRFPDMADPLLRRQFPEKDLNQAVAIAAMCLQEEPGARPLMSDVVMTLSFLSTDPSDIPPPCSPSQSSSDDDGGSSGSEPEYDDDDDEGSRSDDDDEEGYRYGESSNYSDVGSYEDGSAASSRRGGGCSSKGLTSGSSSRRKSSNRRAKEKNGGRGKGKGKHKGSRNSRETSSADDSRRSSSGRRSRSGSESHFSPYNACSRTLKKKEMKTGGEVIVVAVDAGKEIADEAIIWALRNVARNLDTLILLPLIPSRGGEVTAAGIPAAVNRAHQQSIPGMVKKWVAKKLYRDESQALPPDPLPQPEEARKIKKICADMIRVLSRIHKRQLQTQVKVIADAQLGSVASAARELEATWVILDRQLKKEGEICMKQLKCNIVVMEQSAPKVMRTAVNPNRIRRRHSISSRDGIDPTNSTLWGLINHTSSNTSTATEIDSDASSFKIESDEEESFRKKLSETPPGTLFHLDSVLVERGVEDGDGNAPLKEKMPELNSCSDDDDDGDGGDVLISNPHPGASTSGLSKSYSGPSKFEKGTRIDPSSSGHRAMIPPRRSLDGHNLSRFRDSFNPPGRGLSRGNSLISSKTTNLFEEEETEQHCEIRSDGPSNIEERTSSIRRAMPLSIKPPPIPPPLCSMCKHKAPMFGKPPKKFTYEEIKSVTDGFARESILAEGGRGLVYRGKLPNGQVVAVKQYKALTAQGASELCSEVEVLSCAQHKNLVMLLGYCIEREWLLVYEFACNGSLDKHLYRPNNSNHPESVVGEEVMSWEHRMKVAIGSARALRYLHEDCRVGCIVHRDFRPRNILLTHDFEPMAISG
ncbi:Receptor-like kinase LIP2 [Linum grandiflorum]